MFATANDKKGGARNEPPGGRVESAQKISSVGDNPSWQTLAFGFIPLQPKLTISQPDDPGEREADRVADNVMNVQRKCAAACTCAACEEEHTNVQRKALDQSTVTKETAPALVSRALDSAGEPLPQQTQRFMESRLGFDLTNVRTHTDTAAASSATALAARAYTVGNHVVFAPGAFAPQQSEGQRLLAHELTHVRQQAGSATKSVARDPDPTAEAENEGSIRRAITFIEALRGDLASVRRSAHHAIATARGTADAVRRAHPILNQVVIRRYLRRARGVYDAQRSLLNPNHVLQGDFRLAYANFLGDVREAIQESVAIAGSAGPAHDEEESAHTETLMLWLEANPLREQALAGRTAFTAADVSASQRIESHLPSVLPATISGLLPTLNLVQAGASARLRAVIESSRTRITAAGGGPPARTTATDTTQTEADAVLARINGAEQAIERGRVLLRAAIARMDTWLSAPATPSDVPTRLNELFHTQDPGYGRLLRDRLQVMLTNLEGSGRLVVRLHTAGQTQACTDSHVRGQRTLPYEFIFCSISSIVDYDASVLLHELAHAVIPGRGSRASAERGFPQDRAYKGERLMLRMTTEEALNNAESYSHLVRVLTGAWVQAPIVDTATSCTDAAPLLETLALAESANRRARSYLDDIPGNITAGRPITQWLRQMIDRHFSIPADPVLLQIVSDFENLDRYLTIWRMPHSFTCVAARDCPAGVLAMDDRRMYRNGSTTPRRSRRSDIIRVCPAFFALDADVRARVAYVMVSLGFGDTHLQHPNRIWQYASFALELYQSDLGAPPASSLAEHEAADRAVTAPSGPPAAPNRPTTTTPGSPRPNP